MLSGSTGVALNKVVNTAYFLFLKIVCHVVITNFLIHILGISLQ